MCQLTSALLHIELVDISVVRYFYFRHTSHSILTS